MPVMAATPLANSPISSTQRMPKTFTPFPRLPIELRTKIWNYALYTPRIVQLCFHASDPQGYILSLRHRVVPPLLQACSESRQLALDIYPVRYFEQAKSDGQTYLRTDLDTIYLGSPNRLLHIEWLMDYFFSYMPGAGPSIDFEAIRHIAFDVGWWEWFRDYDMLRWLALVEGLKSITLVLEDPKDSEEEARFVELDEFRDGKALVSRAMERLEDIRMTYDGCVAAENSDGEVSEFKDWPLPELKFVKMEGKIFGKLLDDELVKGSEWESYIAERKVEPVEKKEEPTKRKEECEGEVLRNVERED